MRSVPNTSRIGPLMASCSWRTMRSDATDLDIELADQVVGVVSSEAR
jgi:hypothetical protein